MVEWLPNFLQDESSEIEVSVQMRMTNDGTRRPYEALL